MNKLVFVLGCFFMTFQICHGQTYATLPFNDDLSSGTLGSSWRISDAQGIGNATVANLSGDWPNFGTCSGRFCPNVGVTGGNGLIVYNSSSPVGSNQINMDLHLNLAGAGVVELSQAIVDWGSGWDSLQIYLSNDGGSNFTYASTIKLWLNPYRDGIWNEVTLDVSTLASSVNVPFSSTYIVRYAVFLEKRGSATNPKNWPNQSVYFDNFKGEQLGVLPVELSNFTGTAGDGVVNISWSTSAELNNSYFELQKSTNGAIWDALAIIDGAGNSSSVINYSFDDYGAVETQVYYRLKQVDFDGAYKYSNVLSFNSDTELVSLSVLKNGSDPIVTVHGEAQSELVFLSMAGKQIWNKHVNGGDWISTSFLPNGHYIAFVNTANGPVAEKIAVFR